jgi:hypothetical protein
LKLYGICSQEFSIKDFKSFKDQNKFVNLIELHINFDILDKIHFNEKKLKKLHLLCEHLNDKKIINKLLSYNFNSNSLTYLHIDFVFDEYNYLKKDIAKQIMKNEQDLISNVLPNLKHISYMFYKESFGFNSKEYYKHYNFEINKNV